MVGLALLLVLSGTPARQAEAAADLARTYAETDQASPDPIDEMDGGVGDDQLEATRADAATDTQTGANLVAPTLGRLTDTIEFFAGRSGLTLRFALAPLPTISPALRCAWLQRFQF